MSAPAMETSARAMEIPVPAPTRAPFLGFTVDAETRSTLLALAGDRGWPAECVRDGCVPEATAQLAGAATPETLVVDIGTDGSPFVDLSVLADACDAGTRVVVLGEVNDVALFRRLRALGVEDYLLKPVTREVLGAALRQSASARASEGADDGRLIAVMGARGGAGASTVALNLAWTMAHECGLRVALVDFDLGFGSIALALDIEPGRGFRDALESPGRIDGLSSNAPWFAWARGCSSSRPRNPSMRPIRGTRAPSRGCCEGSRGTSMPWSSICRAPWARRCP